MSATANPAGRSPGGRERSEPAAAAPDQQAEPEEHRKRGELRRGEPVLRPFPGPETERVQDRQRQDRRRGQSPPDARGSARWSMGASVVPKPEARAAIDPGNADPEARPPAEEAERGTVRLSQVDVLASRSRKETPELAVGQSARERNRASEKPRAEKCGRRLHGLGDARAHEEDPGAHDAADHEERAVGNAKGSSRRSRHGASYTKPPDPGIFAARKFIAKPARPSFAGGRPGDRRE